MTSPTEPTPPPRRRSSALFGALLLAGLALLALRVVALPGMGVFDMLLPVLGGGLIAAALVVMVIRERAERRAAAPAERDRPDRGMPP